MPFLSIKIGDDLTAVRTIRVRLQLLGLIRCRCGQQVLGIELVLVARVDAVAMREHFVVGDLAAVVQVRADGSVDEPIGVVAVSEQPQVGAVVDVLLILQLDDADVVVVTLALIPAELRRSRTRDSRTAGKELRGKCSRCRSAGCEERAFVDVIESSKIAVVPAPYSSLSAVR